MTRVKSTQMVVELGPSWPVTAAPAGRRGGLARRPSDDSPLGWLRVSNACQRGALQVANTRPSAQRLRGAGARFGAEAPAKSAGMWGRGRGFPACIKRQMWLRLAPAIERGWLQLSARPPGARERRCEPEPAPWRQKPATKQAPRLLNLNYPDPRTPAQWRTGRPPRWCCLPETVKTPP